jgi:magnesium transporter
VRHVSALAKWISFMSLLVKVDKDYVTHLLNDCPFYSRITASNAGQIFLKELRVGFFNGVSMSLLIGILAGAWFGCQSLGLVIGAAMFVNLIAAAMAGVLIPVTLDRLNIDPAVSSSVFVTAVTDCMGFFGFLGLAALFDLGTRCS